MALASSIRMYLVAFCALFLCTGWSWTLASKPGTEALENGRKYLAAKQYTEALATFEAAHAEAVDDKTRATALIKLAEITLHHGKGGYSADQALDLLTEANRMGNPQAYRLAGDAYRYGWGVSRDAERAITYYRQVADRDSNAALSLAKLTGNAAYLQQAIDLVESKTQPPASSLFRLGTFYAAGKTVAKDTVQAEKWFTRAIARDAAYAGKIERWKAKQQAQALQSLKPATSKKVGAAAKRATNMATAYPTDYPQLLALARKGDSEAMLRLGHHFMTLASPADAEHWYHEAATRNHPPAMFHLGLFYTKEQGLNPPDIAKARQWLEKAQAHGYQEAAALLQRLGKTAP